MRFFPLATTSGKKVACKGETSAGEYTGNKAVGNVLIKFTGCKESGAKAKCTSAGSAAGEIATKALAGELGVVKTSTGGPASNEIGSDLKVPGGGAVAEFSCAASAAKLRGSVIVVVETNEMLSTDTLEYTASKGIQKPTHFESKPNEILEMSLVGGPFEQSGLRLTTIQTNSEKVEVNSLALAVSGSGQASLCGVRVRAAPSLERNRYVGELPSAFRSLPYSPLCAERHVLGLQILPCSVRRPLTAYPVLGGEGSKGATRSRTPVATAAPEAEKRLVTKGADANGRYLTIVNVS